MSFLGARTPLKMIVLKLKIVNCIKLCHLFLQAYSIVNPKGFFLFQSIEDLCKGNLPHFYLVLGTNKKDSFVCALILAAASFVFKAKFKYNTNILWLFNFWRVAQASLLVEDILYVRVMVKLVTLIKEDTE